MRARVWSPVPNRLCLRCAARGFGFVFVLSDARARASANDDVGTVFFFSFLFRHSNGQTMPLRGEEILEGVDAIICALSTMRDCQITAGAGSRNDCTSVDRSERNVYTMSQCRTVSSFVRPFANHQFQRTVRRVLGYYHH